MSDTQALSQQIARLADRFRLEAINSLAAAPKRWLPLRVDTAGYRNRLAHFYDEISTEELHDICAEQRQDIALLASRLARWVEQYSDPTDRALEKRVAK
jgi:uncharacterized coiled-coil protein SlyX